MKRDHSKLICDIGELSGACTRSPCLEDFLQKTAEMTAEHMQSEVCSIYLYFDETQELVLQATCGLKPEAVGNVSLTLGEGLTGRALKELRPICVREASKRPDFCYFPDIGEEPYESFLAVPILRGTNRIGAMVVQNSRSHYFKQNDINALKAITSQLATTIETVKILMAIDGRVPAADGGPRHKPLKLLKGRSGAGGVALARSAVMDDQRRFFTEEMDFQRKHSVPEFFAAVEQTETRLNDLQTQVEEKLVDVASLIFTAQILMLKDKPFLDAIVHQIEAGVPAAEAVRRTVHQYVHKFENLPNAYLREKANDVQDVGLRLLEHLEPDLVPTHDYTGRIVIAKELFPSDMLKLSSQNVRGLIALSGGITSHIAILARSLEIPLVFLDDRCLLELAPGSEILLDADQGNIYVDPDSEIRSQFARAASHEEIMAEQKDAMKDETRTRDGTRIKLLSNINLLCDINVARAFKSEGIGLYRTEFPFIVRSDFPSEEEQYTVYKKLVERMPDKEITFRTLDIGGDKVLSYYDYDREENPFLGMRSIRFSLRHREIFQQQLRAILRAGVDADLRIMFPMISSLDEFCAAREEVDACIRQLKGEKIPCCRRPAIGMMIELPAVLEIIDELAQEADFFSIGTNDFIQYMLAVDRTNEKVAELYLPHHPSVLRALKKVVDAGQRHHIEVSICGDMAYDQRYLAYFLGIGVRIFSVDSHLLPVIQQAILKIDLDEARQQTQELLSKHRIDEISAIIDS
ncbi:MAG: phosphoenolpyruvate--protein phosphotransferase [Candidatus Omnitrophota bacterium]